MMVVEREKEKEKEKITEKVNKYVKREQRFFSLCKDLLPMCLTKYYKHSWLL